MEMLKLWQRIWSREQVVSCQSWESINGMQIISKRKEAPRTGTNGIGNSRAWQGKSVKNGFVLLAAQTRETVLSIVTKPLEGVLLLCIWNAQYSVEGKDFCTSLLHKLQGPSSNVEASLGLNCLRCNSDNRLSQFFEILRGSMTRRWIGIGKWFGMESLDTIQSTLM